MLLIDYKGVENFKSYRQWADQRGNNIKVFVRKLKYKTNDESLPFA